MNRGGLFLGRTSSNIQKEYMVGKSKGMASKATANNGHLGEEPLWRGQCAVEFRGTQWNWGMGKLGLITKGHGFKEDRQGTILKEGSS